MPLFSWIGSEPEIAKHEDICTQYLLNTAKNPSLLKMSKSNSAVLEAARHYVQGDWSMLNQLTLDPYSEHLAPSNLLAHCHFYKSLGLWRVDKKAQAQEIWLQILSSDAASIFSPAIILQESSQLMGRGYFAGCLAKVVPLKHGCIELGDFWHLRWLVVVATCYEAQGQYDKATSHTKQLEALCLKYPQPLMQLALLRRKLSLAVETENLAALKKQLDSFPVVTLGFLGPTNSLLLQNERLRATLALGDDLAAAKINEQMQETRNIHGISKEFLTSIDGTCELLLRTKETNLALEKVKSILWDAQLNDDKAGQCAALLFLARILFEQKSWEAALGSLETALRISNQESYGRIRVQLFLCLSLNLKALQRISDATRAAGESAGLAKKFGLHESLRAATMVETLLMTGATRLKTLIETGHTQHSNDKIQKIISTFFPEHCTVRTTHWRGYKEVFQTWELDSYLQSARDSNYLEIWPREGLIYSNKKGNKSYLEIDEKTSVTHKIAQKFLSKYPNGLSLSEVFKLQSKQTFRPERHSSSTAKQILGARKFLFECNIYIEFNREIGKYFLISKHPLRRLILSNSKSTNLTVRKAPTRDRLLKFIQAQQSASTSAACTFLGITRQTLNPIMKELISSGKVIAVGKGKAVCYYFNE